jgi:hypothetical protein
MNARPKSEFWQAYVIGLEAYINVLVPDGVCLSWTSRNIQEQIVACKFKLTFSQGFSCKSPASHAGLSVTLYNFAYRWQMLEHIYLSANSTAFKSPPNAWDAYKSRRSYIDINRPQLGRFFLIISISRHKRCLHPNTWYHHKIWRIPCRFTVL